MKPFFYSLRTYVETLLKGKLSLAGLKKPVPLNLFVWLVNGLGRGSCRIHCLLGRSNEPIRSGSFRTRKALDGWV